MLGGIAGIGPDFRSWAPVGSASIAVDLDPGVVETLMTRGGPPGFGEDGQSVLRWRSVSDDGIEFSSCTGRVDPRHENSVQITYPVSSHGDPGSIEARLVEVLVAELDPDWVVAIAPLDVPAQLPEPGSVIVGDLTYLRAVPEVVGDLACASTRALGGGTLVKLDGGPTAPRTVREQLSARGVLGTPLSEVLLVGGATLGLYQAFLVMSDFLAGYAERGAGLIDVLATIRLQSNTMTGDPASWFDWMESHERIHRGQLPRQFFGPAL